MASRCVNRNVEVIYQTRPCRMIIVVVEEWLTPCDQIALMLEGHWSCFHAASIAYGVSPELLMGDWNQMSLKMKLREFSASEFLPLPWNQLVKARGFTLS